MKETHTHTHTHTPVKIAEVVIVGDSTSLPLKGHIILCLEVKGHGRFVHQEIMEEVTLFTLLGVIKGSR